MLSTRALQEMGWTEQRTTIKNALHVAIDELLARDIDLLVSDAHEQAICHRLAVYLEKSTDLNVDCEYNRNMMRAKMLKEGKRFRPDIIVHRRLRNDENVLVVETKSRAQKGASDLQRLSELTAELSDFQYSAGAFVVFCNRPATMIRTGALRVTIDWFFHSVKDDTLEKSRPIPNDLLQYITEKRSASQATRRPHTGFP